MKSGCAFQSIHILTQLTIFRRETGVFRITSYCCCFQKLCHKLTTVKLNRSKTVTISNSCRHVPLSKYIYFYALIVEETLGCKDYLLKCPSIFQVLAQWKNTITNVHLNSSWPSRTEIFTLYVYFISGMLWIALLKSQLKSLPFFNWCTSLIK